MKFLNKILMEEIEPAVTEKHELEHRRSSPFNHLRNFLGNHDPNASNKTDESSKEKLITIYMVSD